MQDLDSSRRIETTRTAIRLRHFSARTEEVCLSWLRRFIAFRRRRGVVGSDTEVVKQFLILLVERGKVAASTQQQALSTLRFPFDRGRGTPLDNLDGYVPRYRPPRLPVVLSAGEVAAVLEHLAGPKRLVVMLLYGSGSRLLEALNARVKDLDFGRSTVTVRGGKGDKDRSRRLMSEHDQLHGAFPLRFASNPPSATGRFVRTFRA